MIRIGTSGWSYKHWKDVFYPPDLPAGRWFGYYTRFFDTVEINATFYRLFQEKTFEGWQQKAPEDFLYAVKLWRWVTHRKKLKDVDWELQTFCERALKLGDHLGPILVQFPPGLKWAPDLVSNFILRLPRGPLRWAFEPRRKDWLNPDFFDLLKSHGLALVWSDYPGLEMKPEWLGDDPFVYLRFHGFGALYSGYYGDDQLAWWARQIQSWKRAGKDVYAYFNNDAWGNAVKNAGTLKRMVGGNGQGD